MNLLKNFLISSIIILGLASHSVFAAGIDHFEVTLSPETSKVGEALDITIEAVDSSGNTVTDYAGQILVFSESDPEADYPNELKENSYTFSEKDEGKVKFENAVVYKNAGTQDIYVYDMDDDTVLGLAEADISDDGSIKSIEIDILSPENGVTIGEDKVTVSGKTQKNHQVKVMFYNGTRTLTTNSDDSGNFEVIANDLDSGEITFKAEVLDAENNVAGTSADIRIRVESDLPMLKDLTITPNKDVIPESEVIAELISNTALTEVSIIINDTIITLTEGDPGVYTSKFAAPEKEGVYNIDAVLKDELGHETKELGAETLSVKELEAAPEVEEPVVEETPVVEEVIVSEKKRDLTITGLKLIELKTKSILTWNELDDIEGYNIYKVKDKDDLENILDSKNLELIKKVDKSIFEVEITGEEIEYDFFAVKAIAKTSTGILYEGHLSDATKIKTGPELLILLVMSLLIGGLIFFFAKKKRA